MAAAVKRDASNGVRFCEACHAIASGNPAGWYIDPDGIDLCPGCADDLHLTWRIEGFANARP